MLRGAFDWFAARDYDEAALKVAHTTQAKRDLILRALGHPIKCVVAAVESGSLRPNDDGVYLLSAPALNDQYKAYCQTHKTRYVATAFGSTLKTKLGLVPTKRRKCPKTEKRSHWYSFTAAELQMAMRRMLRDPDFALDLAE